MGAWKGGEDWECGKVENDGWVVWLHSAHNKNEKRKRAPRQSNSRALPTTPTASNTVEEGKTYCFTHTHTDACLKKTTSAKPMTGRNAQVTQTHKRQGEKTATTKKPQTLLQNRCMATSHEPPPRVKRAQLPVRGGQWLEFPLLAAIRDGDIPMVRTHIRAGCGVND